MSIDFKNKWKAYTRLWWSKLCPVEFDDLFPIESIVLWGHIPYEIYIRSVYGKPSENPVLLHNTKLDIYFFMRELPSQDNYLTYFFANIVEFKKYLLDLDPSKIELLFLKRLYENNISIVKLFHHKYSINCWEALLEQKQI
jgi:hypothetical protein